MRKAGFIFILVLMLSHALSAQIADRARSEALREARNYVNGCGPEGWPDGVTDLLSWLGDRGVCNRHDIDYGTLGVSQSEADGRLFTGLRLQSWNIVPAVASAYWGILYAAGESAYRSAQSKSREEFRRIHHGNEWNASYGKWHPAMNGHIRMSFPQCTSSCPLYSY
jgi:hypothetical protein